jgi:hypothetical protein
MHGSVVVAWVLTAVFLVLTWPCVSRLVRLDYVSLGQQTRTGDVAELLLVLAMVAMFSPIGGPIPAAGWESVFLLTGGWFAVEWWRGRHGHGHSSAHGQCAHHALSALAMLYVLVAMPETGGMASMHGPWLSMSAMEAQGRLAWPVVAALAAVYFVVDGVRSGVVAVRATSAGAVLPGLTSRAACRAVMGVGMGYMLVTAL